MPVEPYLLWTDIPGYYGLDDRKTYFDDLQDFFYEYEGYQVKIDNLLNAYEAEPE